MKILIASDIHGSYYYMECLARRIEEECPDKIILLGDLLYHGPRNKLPKDYDPAKVSKLLNKYSDRTICCRGNCEAEVDQMLIDFPIMADYVVLVDGNLTIYASHGHIYNEKNAIPGMNGVLLCGHTHVPQIIEEDTFVYINPGSVSIPKEESSNSYVILENKHFVWKDVTNGNETGMVYTWNK